MHGYAANAKKQIFFNMLVALIATTFAAGIVSARYSATKHIQERGYPLRTKF